MVRKRPLIVGECPCVTSHGTRHFFRPIVLRECNLWQLMLWERSLWSLIIRERFFRPFFVRNLCLWPFIVREHSLWPLILRVLHHKLHENDLCDDFSATGHFAETNITGMPFVTIHCTKSNFWWLLGPQRPLWPPIVLDGLLWPLIVQKRTHFDYCSNMRGQFICFCCEKHTLVHNILLLNWSFPAPLTSRPPVLLCATRSCFPSIWASFLYILPQEHPGDTWWMLLGVHFVMLGVHLLQMLFCCSATRFPIDLVSGAPRRYLEDVAGRPLFENVF